MIVSAHAQLIRTAIGVGFTGACAVGVLIDKASLSGTAARVCVAGATIVAADQAFTAICIFDAFTRHALWFQAMAHAATVEDAAGLLRQPGPVPNTDEAIGALLAAPALLTCRDGGGAGKDEGCKAGNWKELHQATRWKSVGRRSLPHNQAFGQPISGTP